MKNNKASKIDRLADALANHRAELSVAQISSRFGLANPTSTIAKLRAEGLNIVLNETRTGVRKYSVVAA